MIKEVETDFALFAQDPQANGSKPLYCAFMPYRGKELVVEDISIYTVSETEGGDPVGAVIKFKTDDGIIESIGDVNNKEKLLPLDIVDQIMGFGLTVYIVDELGEPLSAIRLEPFDGSLNKPLSKMH